MVAAARKGSLAATRAAWRLRVGAQSVRGAFLAAIEREWEERRFFLWLPAAAGTGVLLYLAADREPVVWLPLLLAALGLAGAVAARGRPVPFCIAMGFLALCLGFLAAEGRSRGLATPMLDRLRIAHLQGRVEAADLRPAGARFLLAVSEADDLDPHHRPRRVRLTTRRAEPIVAGDLVKVTARLLPPARAALPGGYDFARDAYFAGIGAVGSALGRITMVEPAAAAASPSDWRQALDRFRNELAARVEIKAGGGDAGAVAAAMVTGKRDRVSDAAREIIREAGIFHIITIAGVQMTLVAALLFGGMRRLLALSPALALRFPTKVWAAVFAMAGALVYDVATGARIGTQRALFMTLIMLGATVFGRRALTMRNLAFAALAVLALEPEAVAGASFQLSFAAVAALIAVHEARQRRPAIELDAWASDGPASRPTGPRPGRLGSAARAVLALFLATVFATAATASFMAADFHELSPYVFVGNPLTLAVIEFFAVPGALLGTFLYPLGLDGWVWQWVGLGIRLVFRAAALLAAAPASTLHVPSFAPWALPCLTLALLSLVIWQTLPLRLTALPWLLLGLAGAAAGPRYDLVVTPTGEEAAVRGADGRLGVLGKANGFAVEQWLRADGDGRDASAVGLPAGARCDRLACVAPLGEGGTISLVAEAAAFEEDCRRATIVVTPLYAPASCAAEVIVDRGSLEETGALAFSRRNGAWIGAPARSPGEDRPWSPAPPRRDRPEAAREPPNAGSEGGEWQ